MEAPVMSESSTSDDGARISSSASPLSSERQFTARVSPTSNRFFSPSPLAESSRWASSSKPPTFHPSRNFPGRRSFMSTPVYPLVFHNPVSDGESSGVTGTSSSHRIMIPSYHSRSSPPWPESTHKSDLKFHKVLSDLHKVGTSPYEHTNSRREAIRWSNGSSSDMALDGDAIDAAEHISIENPRSPNCSLRHQKCGLCYRLLRQKSPWSSHRIVRNSDLPIAGVLPCGHVFHADCLEETTPKSLVQEPPCPLCPNLISHDGPSSSSEPFPVAALRTPRRLMRGATTSGHTGGSGVNRNDIDLRRNLSQPMRGSSSIRSRLRKSLSFKVKISRDLFGTNIFRKF